MTGEERTIQDFHQIVIAKVTEAIYRLDLARENAQAIQYLQDLGADRKRQAIEELVAEAQTFATEAVRGARNGVDGEWVVSRSVPPGPATRPWFEGLSEAGQAARNDMLVYLAAAERVFEVDLEELESGEAPSPEDAQRRDAAREELASYEAAHPAPAGIAAARARWSSPA